MPNIISNTSCLITLDNINALYILKELYHKIYITEEVAKEYGKPIANWVITKSIDDKNYLHILNTIVDLGEASTIALALQMQENNLMILDDLKARKLAKQLNCKYTGLLGVLLKAKQQSIISSVTEVFDQLDRVNFRVSEPLKNEVLKLAGEL